MFYRPPATPYSRRTPPQLSRIFHPDNAQRTDEAFLDNVTPGEAQEIGVHRSDAWPPIPSIGSIHARAVRFRRVRLSQAVLTALAVFSFAASAVPVRADCTCRLDGASVPIGTMACMAPAGPTAFYRCAMNRDVTTWQKIGDACPSADLTPAAPDPHRIAVAGALDRPPIGGLSNSAMMYSSASSN